MHAQWQSKEVGLVVPAATARAMWQRARDAFDVSLGGRFDARSRSTLLIWSRLLTAPGAQPIGAVTMAWDAPTPGQATIRLISWRIDAGGSEHHVWRALETLAGTAWPFTRRRERRLRRVA